MLTILRFLRIRKDGRLVSFPPYKEEVAGSSPAAPTSETPYDDVGGFVDSVPEQSHARNALNETDLQFRFVGGSTTG